MQLVNRITNTFNPTNLKQRLKKLSVYIYDIIISYFLTLTSHRILIQHLTLLSGSFLDVGCGTGTPLKSITPALLQSYSQVVGVDLHPEYTQQAKDLFQDYNNVQIYLMDFYDIRAQLKQKFNFILFSFSFMLMPDKVKALLVAKSILSTDGKIAFILTLNQSRNRLLQTTKPIIKKLTTIDFGEVVYRTQFEQILQICNLQIQKQVRIQSPYNLILKIAHVYYIQCRVKE